MDPAFRLVADRVPAVGEETKGQVAAAIDGDGPGFAGPGERGVLTAGQFPGDGPFGPGDALAPIDPLDAFDAADPLDPFARSGPVQGRAGPGGLTAAGAPAQPSGLGGSPGPVAAPGMADVLGPGRCSPCGTGWPAAPPSGDGRARASSPSASAPDHDHAHRSARRERTCPLADKLGSVPLARDFARATVRGWGLPELCDDVTSVVSELVTNALRYGLAGYAFGAPGLDGPALRRPVAPIELRMMLRPADVICMVADPGAGVPEVGDPGYYAEGGRGLHVVASCSDRWGWDQLAGGGKVVWAAFRL